MIKFFGEISIGERFTYILFGYGKQTFEKITDRDANLICSNGKEFTYPFNYNDCVKLVKE